MSLPTNRLLQWASGIGILHGDLTMLGEVIQDLVGGAVSTLLGASSLNSPIDPLTVSVSGANVFVAPTAGGANSPVFLLAGRLVAEIDGQTELTPDPATLGRIDTIEAQTTEFPVAPFTRLVQPSSGPPEPQTCYELALSCTFRLKKGVDSGSPTPPPASAGWTAVGTVTMPASGGNPTSAAITLPMPPTLDANSGLQLGGIGPGDYAGVGVPTFAAMNGSTYRRKDGGSGARLYINSSGANTIGTSWTALGGV